jgi:nucleotide-binding universal stress UspA family protein
MYRSLLVPLDGTELAEHALPISLSLARRHGAALQVVRIYVPVSGVYGRHVLYDEELDRELMTSARAYLDDVVQRVTDAAPIPVSSVLLEGPVADAISAHAAASGADLLVMTSRGRGAIARFLLGSVADQLARQASIRILFVPPREEAPDLAREPVIRRVLIPLDGSELAEQIIEPALALGAGTQVEYTLLRVAKRMMPPSYDPDSARVSGLRPSLLKQLQELDHREWTQAEEYLEEFAGRLRSRSVAVHTRVVANERAAVAILDEASTGGADLIAIATNGRGGLKRLLLGSVTDRVLRAAETPVLLCRPAMTPSAGNDEGKPA